MKEKGFGWQGRNMILQAFQQLDMEITQTTFDSTVRRKMSAVKQLIVWQHSKKYTCLTNQVKNMRSNTEGHTKAKTDEA